MEALNEFGDRLEHRALAPLTHTTWRFYAWVGFLVAVIGIAAYAYFTQLRDGLVVTGLGDRISWGMYITLFVTFIGVSKGGTLVSAVLRASGAAWRSPVTRTAEIMTIAALVVGFLLPIIDLGRPENMLNMVFHGRWQSPVMWDFLGVTTYLVASLIYLYLPLIPDFAIVRDRLGKSARLGSRRRRLYSVLALGWRGTPAQIRQHTTALKVMMILVIPLAVTVHTVLSWIFGMTSREAWDTAIFGVLFVGGAIFSGIAMVIIVIYVVRRVYHLEAYITIRQFRNLGYLMAMMTMVLLYINIAELLTGGYKATEDTVVYHNLLFTGKFAWLFWFYIFGGLVIPGAMFLVPWARNRVWPIVTVAVLVIVAMTVERYFLVVGGMRTPTMPYEPSNYMPSFVEWAIMAGAFALFALIITLFTKFAPIVAVWEIEEAYEEETTRPVTIPAATTVAAPAMGGGD